MLLCPLTSATRAIFNRRSTAQLKDGSFRINNVTLGTI
jgi:phosphoglycerate dehydrogenase-like enzyme